jgi:hypothetical protein
MAPNTQRLAALMLARSPDAKALVVGSVSVRVPMDDRQEIVDDGAGGGVKASEKALLVAVGSVPAVTREQVVMWDGTAYTVRDTFRQENGDFERWVLVPVAP